MKIEPPSLNSGSAFCTVNSVPRALSPKAASKCSSVISPSRRCSPSPALAHSTSIVPFSRLTVSNSRSRSAKSAASPCTPVTFRPISLTASSSASCRRPEMKTCAPSSTNSLAPAMATPGAGKTVFGLRIAAELLSDRTIEAVTIVTPTEHLKHQWAASAAAAGIAIDSNFRNTTGVTSSDYNGVALTYAQVAAHPTLHRVRTENRKTLVILDEIHHGGDAKSWGDAIREAFTPAVRRLSLTGTPFRSDDSPIPFVNYEPDPAGFQRSRADHTYGYSDALADGVV